MVLSPLDKLDESPDLRLLRSSVSRRLPQADLPEVLLEIHRRTGFANDFTHISEAEARADDLATSVCAVLLAQACNVGFAPLINPYIPALPANVSVGCSRIISVPKRLRAPMLAW